MRMQAARTEIESGSLALVLRALGIEFGGPTWSSCCRALMLVLACALFNVIMFLVHILGQSSSAWSSLLSVFTMDFIWVAGFVSYFSYRSGLRVALREMAVILFKYRRPVEEDCGWENEVGSDDGDGGGGGAGPDPERGAGNGWAGGNPAAAVAVAAGGGAWHREEAGAPLDPQGQGEGASHELEERPGDEVDCADACLCCGQRRAGGAGGQHCLVRIRDCLCGCGCGDDDGLAGAGSAGWGVSPRHRSRRSRGGGGGSSWGRRFHRQSVAPLHAIDGASPSSPAAAAATAAAAAAAGSGSGSGSDGEGRAGRAPRCAADDGAAAADGLLDSLSRQALKGYPESMASLRRALADLHPRDTPSSALRVQRLRFAQGVAALAAALALFTAFEGLTLAFDFASFRAAELSTGIPAELLIAASILSYVFSVAAPLGSTVGAAALLGVLSSEPLRIRATLLAMSRVAPVDHHSLHHHHSGHGLDQAGVYGRLGAGPLLAAAATAVGRGTLPGLAAAGSGPGAGLVPQLVPLRRMPSGASMQGFLDDTASAQPRNPSRLGSTPPRPLDGYAAAELRRAAPVPVPRRNGGGAVAVGVRGGAAMEVARRRGSAVPRASRGRAADGGTSSDAWHQRAASGAPAAGRGGPASGQAGMLGRGLSAPTLAPDRLLGLQRASSPPPGLEWRDRTEGGPSGASLASSGLAGRPRMVRQTTEWTGEGEDHRLIDGDAEAAVAAAMASQYGGGSATGSAPHAPLQPLAGAAGAAAGPEATASLRPWLQLFDAQLARVRAQRRTASRISRQMGGPSALISVLMLAAGLLFLVLSQSMTGGSSVATIGFASLFFAVSQLPLLLFAMYTAALRKPLLVVASAPAGVLAQCAALRGPALSVLLSARLETDAVSLLGAVIDPASAIRLASLQVSLVVLAIQQMGGIRLSLDV